MKVPNEPLHPCLLQFNILLSSRSEIANISKDVAQKCILLRGVLKGSMHCAVGRNGKGAPIMSNKQKPDSKSRKERFTQALRAKRGDGCKATPRTSHAMRNAALINIPPPCPTMANSVQIFTNVASHFLRFFHKSAHPTGRLRKGYGNTTGTPREHHGKTTERPREDYGRGPHSPLWTLFLRKIGEIATCDP